MMNEMMQVDELDVHELSTIRGGWGNVIGSVIGALDGGGPTLEQLNGVRLPKPRSCSPYGVGGTPNSCNW